MKHDDKQIVRIPVGCVCIPLNEVIYTHTELADLRRSNTDMAQLIKQRDYRVAELEAQVSELEQKNVELEKDVKDKDDSVMYWFNKYQALCNERDKEKSDAETKTT